MIAWWKVRPMVELEHARALLEQMGLSTSAQLLDAQLERSLHAQQAYAQFLNELLSHEQQERERKSRETRLKLSRLPPPQRAGGLRLHIPAQHRPAAN